MTIRWLSTFTAAGLLACAGTSGYDATPAPADGAAHVGAHAGHTAHSQHGDKADRALKALPDERVAALLAGEGAEYALAAELNRYPGPRHVLDLADELDLTREQHDEILRIWESMNARARRLGQRLVTAERELDAAFRERSITPEHLEALTRSIGALEAQLRYVHLEAHLQTTTLLSHPQIRRYDTLRGYAH
jgi:hypothetical protein